MQCPFSHLILIYSNLHIDTIYQRFSRTMYHTLAFQGRAGVRWETPRCCCLGVLLIFHRAQCAGEPCWSSPGAGWCGGPCALPSRTSADANPSESRKQESPPSPPHPHGKTRRAAESRARGASESNPSTKGIGQADNQRHRFPLPASKLCGFGYSWATLLAQALFR